MTADERRALAAGVPPKLLLALIRGRRMWHEANADIPVEVKSGGLSWSLTGGWWIDDDLREAVHHPLAPTFDGVFVAAMRREFRL